MISLVRFVAPVSATALTIALVVPTHAVAAPANRPQPAACAASGAATFTVASGDTWIGIAKQVGVALRDLLAANGAQATTVIRPGDALCLPAGTAPPADRACTAGRASYTVLRGDTWSGIAKRAGTKLRPLLDANGATAATVIHPGDVLCLPPGATLTSSVRQAASSTSVQLAALPLQGPCWYGDSWHAPRGGGRKHEGVDLIATSGSYVYAVVDGTLTRRVWDQPGRRAGNGWWLTSADGSGTYFFYAHLSDFAPNLEVGSSVRAGQIIGFLGTTGNSAGPHLHFEIHPGGGAAVNPYPIVKAAGGCKTGDGYEQPGGWIP
jgi:murein DD-endopeptidase MepM/ murein hydrolase activator NlpD